MKKELYKNFAVYEGCDSNSPGEHEDPPYVPSNSEISKILEEIFSVDEKSGLPKGDIAYWLSPSGNPQVKDFIVNNLMKPSSRSGSRNADLNDDIIEEYARKSDESVEQYASRLRGYYDQAQSILDSQPKDE